MGARHWASPELRSGVPEAVLGARVQDVTPGQTGTAMPRSKISIRRAWPASGVCWIAGTAHNLPINSHPLPIQAWHKSVHTLADPDAPILAARWRGTVNVEGELAVVIGKTSTELTPQNALEHVLGFTCVNDVTKWTRVPWTSGTSREGGRELHPAGSLA
jgi:hypothetical protein